MSNEDKILSLLIGLTDDVKSIKVDITDVKVQLSNVESRLSNVETEIVDLKTKVDELDTKTVKLDNSIITLENTFDTKTKTLFDGYTSNDEKLVALSNKIDMLADDVATQELEIIAVKHNRATKPH